MITFLIVLHVIICVLLVVTVLLQFGKGAEMGAIMGGGSSQAVFSSSAKGNFMTKLTTVLAIGFMLNSIVLSTIKSREAKRSLFDSEAPVAAPLNSDVQALDTKAIETLIEEFRKTHASFEPWQLVLIKTPHQAYSGEDDPILIADEQLNAEPLNDMSFIIHAISDKPEHTAFLCIDREKMHDKPVMQFIHKLAQYSNKISV